MNTAEKFAGSIGKRLVAGFAGTAAMTVSSTLEAKLRGRAPSTAPARATAGVPPGKATAMHGATVWGSAQVTLPALDIALPAVFWPKAEIAIDAVLYEAELPLRRLMALNVGDTLMLDLKSDAPVIVRCGDTMLTEGRMGRVGDRVAVRVGKPLRKPSTTLAMFETAGGVGNRMEGQ